jgi:tetratricopeptide (TPR) repeat protein
LASGKLADVERIGAKLKSDGRADAGTSPEVLHRLVEAIGSVLAGDNRSGLTLLDEIRESMPADVSLQWAALIWSARASLAIVNGVEAARGFAESALHLSTKLDVEARATSAVTVGQVSFQNGDHRRALQWIARARQVFERTADRQVTAAALLLEARVLVALGRHEEATRAAERAGEHRPSWPAPAAFVAVANLGTGTVKAVQRTLQDAAKKHPKDADLQRTAHIVGHVAAGIVPADTAREFLLSMHAPPRHNDVERLTGIVEAFPDILQFSEALGWKLFQAGSHEESLRVFESLSQKEGLPEHIRASVLLAAGYLATVELRDAKAPARLRAAVNAKSGSLSAPPGQSTPRSSEASDGPPVFVGNLQAIPLPDLLEFLRAGRKTGTLVCSSAEGIGAIHLRSGRITSAAAPRTRPIREYILEKTSVTAEQLETVATSQDNDDSRPLIGELLVTRGLATSDQIRKVLTEQIHDAIGELLNWKNGQFAFDPEKVTAPLGPDIEVEVDPQALLLEVFRRMDERHR